MIKKILAYFDRKRQEERQHQIHMLQILSDQQIVMQENSLKILDATMKEVLDVSKKQFEVFKAWMDAFKVVDTPKSTTIRDEDEVKAETERLRSLGYPIDATVEEQVKWIVKDLGEDELNG